MAAVFGAAARVPIATMLMVTEMAGGFHLLVPAGMAVMISYLLQDRLSAKLKYRSLYEGQVPTRQDSPAHYLEHIQIALSLLGKRDMPFTDQVGHLDLLRMLQSRIHFDLPGKRELTMAQVEPDSTMVGKTIATLYQRLQEYQFEIIAVMRREHVILPHRETVLQPDDRLVLIASPHSREPLAQFFSPLPAPQDAGLQASAPETPS
jgi:CIC family chloride channel protein